MELKKKRQERYISLCSESKIRWLNNLLKSRPMPSPSLLVYLGCFAAGAAATIAYQVGQINFEIVGNLLA